MMTFNDKDEFVRYDKRNYGNLAGTITLLQTEDDVHYPEPRPIGEMMMMMRDSDEIRNDRMLSKTAKQDAQVLTGSQLNDEEDFETTIESMATAEKMHGAEMKIPEVSSNKEFNKSGSKIHNILEDDHRIYTAELDNAMNDQEIIAKREAEAKAKRDAELKKKQAQKKEIIEAPSKEAALHYYMTEDDDI